MSLVLYLHILAACAWIGGSIVLFGLGVALRDPKVQSAVYGVIGPFYGYFETVWLITLIITGVILGDHYGLLSALNTGETELDHLVERKLILVCALGMATVIHLFIAFKTHQKERSLYQKLLSRGGSMAIFFLNLAILWVAMQIRSTL